ncbi:response regulator transcription factor [Glycomyces sp. YM15]|uniref:winged helix-turn-helix domain-containing protein n=1 Tax=Glycomyces sp. YM15 TaxID=2800446 RepID=UPI0019650D96|nr:response regulator transcription factor [Glycomyces sp. YM15]
MRILLVEDDRDLGPVLAMGLRGEAYAVDLAATCAEAEALLCCNDFDAVCLDLGLPDGDGLELLRRLGTDPALRRPRRVLVLTARDAVDDRVAGLDAGAADYLVKPFSFQELAARLRALARRTDAHDAVLAVGDLRLDTAAHRAWRGGVELDLTPREFSMLRYLMHYAGRTVSAEELLEHVWDANADPFTASVRVILSRLRRKLGEPGPISTVTGVGYVLREAP